MGEPPIVRLLSGNRVRWTALLPLAETSFLLRGVGGCDDRGLLCVVFFRPMLWRPTLVAFYPVTWCQDDHCVHLSSSKKGKAWVLCGRVAERTICRACGWLVVVVCRAGYKVGVCSCLLVLHCWVL